MNKYKVTCQKCKGEDELTITDQNQVFYKKHTPIISARFRPDLKWGFECECNNDSRVAPQEKDQVGILVRGGDHAIDAIKKALKPKNELKFRMEKI